MRRSAPWLLTLLLAGCSRARDPVAFPPFGYVTAPEGATAYYDRDLQAVFTRSCTNGCHEPGGTGVRLSGLDLTEDASFHELLDATSSRNGPHVLPGLPDLSPLVWKLEGHDGTGRAVYGARMPQGAPPLTADEVRKIRDWIEEGALPTKAPPVPPGVVGAAAVDSTAVDVTFTETLDRGSAELAANYAVEGAAGAVAVQSAQMRDERTVRLSTGVLLADSTYTVRVAGVRDLSGLTVAPGAQAAFIYVPVVSFSGRIQPLLTARCASVGCHAASPVFSPGAGLVLTAGQARSNLVGRPSTQRPPRLLVAPGDPDASYLVHKVEGRPGIEGLRMPYGSPPLAAADQAAFRRWVGQGAADN
jgi:hypothetical protein